MWRTLLFPPALLVLVSCTSCGASVNQGPAPEWSEPSPTALRARPDGPARTWSALGTNLDGPVDWNQAIPLIDGFRLSRNWNNAPPFGQPEDNRPIELDERGFIRTLAPGQRVRTGALWDVPHARGGRYTVFWSGRGDVGTHGGAQGRVVARTDHSMTVDWDPQRDGMGFGIQLSNTDPDDPVREIRVIPPGGACREDAARFCETSSDDCACMLFIEHYESQIFHPDFLATLGSYGALRFMNWQVTNRTEQRRWADRTRLDDARWVAGFPVELLVELANRTASDPWFCMPHQADDDYVRNFGRLVRELLDPELTVRVELSNEIWNDMFPQANYATEEGWSRGYAPRDDPGRARTHWTAHRSVEIWHAFDEGFADDARTIHVLGTYGGNPYLARELLEVEAAAAAMDELALAPYFGQFVGPDQRDDVIETGVDGLLAYGLTSIDETLGQVREAVALAAQHGAHVVAYEGGQHYVAVGGLEHDEEVQALMSAVNRDPRIGELYTRYLEGWHEAGGTLFVHFVNAGGWGRYGNWGALEHPRQDITEAPKYLALERFARTTPRWF